MARRSPSVFRFWLASWYGPNPVYADKFYEGVIYPLVWLGVYRSVPEAEADSLVRILQHGRRLRDEKLLEMRNKILALDQKLSG